MSKKRNDFARSLICLIIMSPLVIYSPELLKIIGKNHPQLPVNYKRITIHGNYNY